MIDKPAPAISQEEYRAALRGDFHTFMRRCFAELNSGASFLSNWHLKVVAAKLQAVAPDASVGSSSTSRLAI